MFGKRYAWRFKQISFVVTERKINKFLACEHTTFCILDNCRILYRAKEKICMYKNNWFKLSFSSLNLNYKIILKITIIPELMFDHFYESSPFKVSPFWKISFINGICLSICQWTQNVVPMLTFEKMIGLLSSLVHIKLELNWRLNSLASCFPWKWQKVQNFQNSKCQKFEYTRL